MRSRAGVCQYRVCVHSFASTCACMQASCRCWFRFIISRKFRNLNFNVLLSRGLRFFVYNEGKHFSLSVCLSVCHADTPSFPPLILFLSISLGTFYISSSHFRIHAAFILLRNHVYRLHISTHNNSVSRKVETERNGTTSNSFNRMIVRKNYDHTLLRQLTTGGSVYRFILPVECLFSYTEANWYLYTTFYESTVNIYHEGHRQTKMCLRQAVW